MGLAASSLCINRRLAAIASSRSVIQDRKSKTRGIAIDLALGIGLPVFQMVVSYVFQPHRFDIMEGVGPEPLIWPCVGSILLYYSCPVLLYLISAVYGGTQYKCTQLTSQHTRLGTLYYVEPRSSFCFDHHEVDWSSVITFDSSEWLLQTLFLDYQWQSGICKLPFTISVHGDRGRPCTLISQGL